VCGAQHNPASSSLFFLLLLPLSSPPLQPIPGEAPHQIRQWNATLSESVGSSSGKASKSTCIVVSRGSYLSFYTVAALKGVVVPLNDRFVLGHQLHLHSKPLVAGPPRQPSSLAMLSLSGRPLKGFSSCQFFLQWHLSFSWCET
jgi:hypothetical protein